MKDHPLKALLNDRLSGYDFGVLEHGFLPHGRDYRFLIQDSLCTDPGTYELIFTHVVDMKYETRVDEKVWLISWADEFTDYAKWKVAGEPEGHVFGTDWSLAYPGIDILRTSPDAQDWSKRLQRPMHLASIETDRFLISLVFSTVRHRRVSDDVGIVRRVLVRLPLPGKVQ